MLSTKNISTEAKSKAKNLYYGNQQCKINSIALEPGWKLGVYKLILNLEGPEQGADFEGFYVDPQNPALGRYKGQISKVRFYQYSYEDRVNNGVEYKRDTDILKSLKSLAITLGKGKELDDINANTIEEFVEKASVLLSGPTFLNFCLGGKQYTKDGYKKYDLFVPAWKNGEVGFEAVGTTPSKLAKFDEAKHLIIPKEEAQEVASFEPGVEDDFNL